MKCQCKTLLPVYPDGYPHDQITDGRRHQDNEADGPASRNKRRRQHGPLSSGPTVRPQIIRAPFHKSKAIKTSPRGFRSQL